MRDIATRELTDLQAAFVRHMADTGDVQASALHAKCSREHGYALLRQPNIVAALQHNVRRKILAAAPLALKVTIDILKTETVNAKTRLDAAKMLLERAGHVAPRAAVEKPGDQPLNEMTTDQLRELAGRLEDEIAGRAKTVSSANLAPSEAQASDLIG